MLAGWAAKELYKDLLLTSIYDCLEKQNVGQVLNKKNIVSGIYIFSSVTCILNELNLALQENVFM